MSEINLQLINKQLQVLLKHNVKRISLSSRFVNIRSFFEYFTSGKITIKNLEMQEPLYKHDNYSPKKLLETVDTWSTYGELFKVYFNLYKDNKHTLIIRVSENHPFLDGTKVRWECEFNITDVKDFIESFRVIEYINNHLEELSEYKYKEFLREQRKAWQIFLKLN